MTLYESMREIAKKHNLPEHQNENFAHLEEQMLSCAKTLYDNNATELGIILLAFAMDLHHCRMRVIRTLIDIPNVASMKDVTDVLVSRTGEVINNSELSTKEKRDIPPTPPKESKEKAPPPPPARTRARV